VFGSGGRSSLLGSEIIFGDQVRLNITNFTEGPEAVA
jgi:hypothetical protein